MLKLHKLHLQIRHADWPFIIQGFLTFFILSLLGYLVLNSGQFIYFLLVISLLFLLLSFVHFHNLQKQETRHFQYKVQAINELMKLLPVRAPLPAMTGWAATPELALNVMKIIQATKPKMIVETGSGVSTIICAYALEKFSPEGVVFSFDHDIDYANETRRELQLHQLEKYTRIHDSPLTTITFNEREWKWYDIDFSNITEPIDLLIIDGPPLKTQKNARYPALPLFYPRLSNDAVIILHDANRDTELETIKNWKKEFPDFESTFLPTEKGIMIFKRKEQ